MRPNGKNTQECFAHIPIAVPTRSALEHTVVYNWLETSAQPPAPPQKLPVPLDDGGAHRTQACTGKEGTDAWESCRQRCNVTSSQVARPAVHLPGTG